jgi:hypothetical protein
MMDARTETMIIRTEWAWGSDGIARGAAMDTGKRVVAVTRLSGLYAYALFADGTEKRYHDGQRVVCARRGGRS